MKIDWQKLTARERNELVAIKVLGWVKETRRMYGGEKNVKGIGFNTHLHKGDYNRGFCPEWSEIPDYSNKVELSMGLISENFEHFKIKKVGSAHQDLVYQVAIFDSGVFHSGYSCSLPEAICLAALKAKGVCFV